LLLQDQRLVSDAPNIPVTPRPAASLVVLRRAGGPEVLMGMRGAQHRFMPNRLVFPGGAVDDADHAAPHATPLRADVQRRLEKSAEPSLARALAIAAARELLEETGLTLGSPPALDGLDYLCRAVTPPGSPVRFDAHFLVVDAERVTGVLAGSGELEDLRWFAVAEALALDIATPTRGVLQRLQAWMAMTEAERRAQTAVWGFYNRQWVEE
jgi:8-oxo-dGTP pyrophosphatase MutT (NUDIX family)